MRFVKILALASIFLPLGACSGDRPELPPIIATDTRPPPPPLPADIENCPRQPYGKTAAEIMDMNAGEVAIIVEEEQGKLRMVSRCLVRLICLVKEYRSLVSKVEGERLCTAPPAGRR